MPESIVITGGRGFVGRHLVTALQQTYPTTKVMVWDIPEVDITNPATYQDQLQTEQPEWVIHLAALAAVGDSYKNPERVHQINVEGTRQLLESIETSSPATKVMAISSADIYGIAANEYGGQPLPELALDQAQPNSPYAQSKWAMEKLIVEQFNQRCMRVRPFPHIGPGQQTGFVTADFAEQIAKAEIGKQAPIIKVGNLEAIRDFTDVRDVVQAYCLLLEKGEMGEVYHVASGRGVKIQAILGQLLKLATVPISIETDETRLRPSDVPVLVGDASKLQSTTDWEPKIPPEQSLQDILNDWRQRAK